MPAYYYFVFWKLYDVYHQQQWENLQKFKKEISNKLKLNKPTIIHFRLQDLPVIILLTTSFCTNLNLPLKPFEVTFELALNSINKSGPVLSI